MKKLTPPVDLLRNSFKIYFQKQNFFYLIKTFLFGFLVLGLSVLPAIIFWIVINSKGTELVILSVALFILPVLLCGSLLGSSFVVAIGNAANGETIGIKETFRRGWQTIWGFIGTSLLTSLIIIAGYLLIVPGLIFQVWFGFAIFIAVIEKMGVLASIKKSKELVKGYFWPVAGRLLVFMILNLIIQSASSIRELESIGSIVSLLLTPYFMLLPFLLYGDLKRVKGI